ncbi:hypothetical protein RRG08_050331 [Elysia crispata]|uniref:Uncharacterized protein n=1 Tax=Elysia crispata TaxID=231223 RepID=A0AAE1DQF6_9GAST|nr:hypothetical protein RRG08_050331 [Elysia crispata]
MNTEEYGRNWRRNTIKPHHPCKETEHDILSPSRDPVRQAVGCYLSAKTDVGEDARLIHQRGAGSNSRYLAFRGGHILPPTLLSLQEKVAPASLFIISRSLNLEFVLLSATSEQQKMQHWVVQAPVKLQHRSQSDSLQLATVSRNGHLGASIQFFFFQTASGVKGLGSETGGPCASVSTCLLRRIAAKHLVLELCFTDTMIQSSHLNAVSWLLSTASQPLVVRAGLIGVSDGISNSRHSRPYKLRSRAYFQPAAPGQL